MNMDKRLAARISTILFIFIRITSSISDDDFMIVEGNFKQLPDTHQNIVGGVKAAIEELPFQVTLRRRGMEKPFCGGSIIDDYWVITAAHCLVLDRIPPKDLEVVIGISRLATVKYGGGLVASVSFYVTHPGFNLTEMTIPGHDLALIRTNQRMTNLWWIPTSKIALANPNDDSIGTRGFVSGFGARDESIRKASTELFKAKVQIFPVSWCRVLAMTEFDERIQICAGAWEGWMPWMTGYRSSVCFGDSGGPLVVKSRETSKLVLIGITSFGFRCGVWGLPSVFTRVSYFRNWIRHIIFNQT